MLVRALSARSSTSLGETDHASSMAAVRPESSAPRPLLPTSATKVILAEWLGILVVSARIETTGSVPATSEIAAVAFCDAAAARPAEETKARKVYWPGGSAPRAIGQTQADSLTGAASSHGAPETSAVHAHCTVSPPLQVPALASQVAAATSGSREAHALSTKLSLAPTVRSPPASDASRAELGLITVTSEAPQTPSMQPVTRRRYGASVVGKEAPETRRARCVRVAGSSATSSGVPLLNVAT